MGAASAADAEDGLGLVNEQEGELAVGGAFAALKEEVTDLTFRFTDPHVEDFGALDVDEELGVIDAGSGADLLAEIEGSGLAEEGFSAARGTMEEEAFGHGMVEALEEIRVEKGEFDGVAYGLDRLVLTADGGPGQFGNVFEGAVDTSSGAQDFEGDALVQIETNFEAGFEFLLPEQGGADDDGRGPAGFGAESEAVVGEDLIDLDDWSVGVEAEALNHDERLVAEDAFADVEDGEGDLGVDPGDIVGTADADMGLVGFDGPEEGADAEGGGSKFFEGDLVSFERGAGVVIHFLQGDDPLAEVGEVEQGRMARGQLGSDDVEELERRQAIKVVAGQGFRQGGASGGPVGT